MGSSSASTLTLGSYNLSSEHHLQQQQQEHHNQHDHGHHHHQQRQLQSLSSANYNDLDHHHHHHHHNDLNLVSTHDATADQQHEHHHLHHHHHDPHLIHLQQHHHHHHHQLHHLTSEALDQNPLIMSSSSDSGLLGLNGDLEDLDYNKVVDPSTILSNPTQHYEKPQDQENLHQSQQQLQQQQQHQPQSSNSENANNIEQSSSTASSKTKLNTPRRNAWGNMSYADLISQAINSTTDKRLTLSQIYDWMVQHVPYFKDKGDSNSSAGWKNSVRHNLSLHNRFKRLQNEGTGKSSWWTINPETNVGKCARRRAASMEASKYEKKRGRAKKRADAIRQGLVSYPSLTSSLLNGSSGNLDASDLQKIQAGTSTITIQVHSKQEADNSKNASSQPIDSGLYNPQYEQKDIELHQMQQKQQPQQQMSHSPPKETLPLHQTQQDVDTSSQQQQQLQQPQQQQQQQQPLSDQVQQIHQIVHKTEQADFESYYIQHNHQDLHQLQNHQGHLNSRDQIDLFNRHAIYLSEPCNDCNCTELINCGTNAMSYT